MSKFKLPRKVKKQYKKDNRFFRVQYDQVHYNWFKDSQRVRITAMRVILKYPEVATKEEMLAWYKEHYPEDKRAHQICEQLKHYMCKERKNIRDYFECPRCEINSEGDRMCPCPRSNCEAEIVGQVVVVKTIIKNDEEENS